VLLCLGCRQELKFVADQDVHGVLDIGRLPRL